MERVVITGMGLKTSLGHDRATCWERLASGVNGITPLTFWNPAEYQTKVAAQIPHLPRETGLESLPGQYCRRSVRLFLDPVAEAWKDAGLERGAIPSPQIGLSLGVSVNYLDMSLMRDYFRHRDIAKAAMDLPRMVSKTTTPSYAFFRRTGDTIASIPARQFGIGGPALVCDTACSASAHAIGEAFRMVRRGEVTAMVAGGSAALVSPLSILAFSLLGALSRSADPAEASRPFDRKRDGFVMGEGAGAVVLESLASAQARGARIHAEVTGFGSTMNAFTLTDPSPDGVMEAAAMKMALEDGGMQPDEVDYIAAHGTSTPKNDVTETQAIKAAFGGHARRLLVSSNKGQIGHTISAAGVCSLVFATEAMRHQCAPPTMHLRQADRDCDLDYVPNQARPARIRGALVNAFAFGGQNAVLALRAWQGGSPT